MGKKKLKRKVLEYANVKKDYYYLYENGDVEIISTGKKKKKWINGENYAYASLCTGEGNTSVSVSLHRLVALHFIPRTDDDIARNRIFVHFKDFNKKHIDIYNLMWVNAQELRVLTDMYYDNPRNTKDYAKYICELLSKGYESEDICSILGLSKQKFSPIIAKIYRRSIYKDISKKYKF